MHTIQLVNFQYKFKSKNFNWNLSGYTKLPSSRPFLNFNSVIIGNIQAHHRSLPWERQFFREREVSCMLKFTSYRFVPQFFTKKFVRFHCVSVNYVILECNKMEWDHARDRCPLHGRKVFLSLQSHLYAFFVHVKGNKKLFSYSIEEPFLFMRDEPNFSSITEFGMQEV